MDFSRTWEGAGGWVVLQTRSRLGELIIIVIYFNSLSSRAKRKLTHLFVVFHLVIYMYIGFFFFFFFILLIHCLFSSLYWAINSLLGGMSFVCDFWRFNNIICCGLVKVVVVLCGVQLEWRKGKVNPFVSGIRARLRPEAMPLNIVHDKDGLPRIILTEPTGSSAEVCFTNIIN